jgi:FtsH-binding integral membrane protein
MDMDTVYYLLAASLTVTAILAAIAIWAPRSLPLRITAVILTAVFVPLAYARLTTLLSRPKPVDFAWFERNAETAHVQPPRLQDI